MSYRVRVTNAQVIDVRSIHGAIRALGFERQDQRTALFLSTIAIYGRTFQFAANERGFDKLRVLCPRCGERKQVLVVVEGDARCRSCHKLAEPSRCRTRRREVIHARYLRPWVLRTIYELKLAGATGRRRSILLNKLGKLKQVCPYATSLYDDGQVPVKKITPPYYHALARVL